jgi:citrate synthase
MSDENAKTPADHIGDTLSQLKEMRHYSKNNVEALTTSWLLFDGELSKLKQAEKIADLMDRQGQLHEALETTITELEEVLEKMKPEPEA